MSEMQQPQFKAEQEEEEDFQFSITDSKIQEYNIQSYQEKKKGVYDHKDINDQSLRDSSREWNNMSQITDTNDQQLPCDKSPLKINELDILREKDLNIDSIPKGNFKGLQLLKSHGPSYRQRNKDNLIED